MKAPVRIGDVTLTSRVVQAPLSGYSHLPYRVLSRERGAGLVCAEMVSSRALVHGSEKTRAQLRTDPAEGAVSMQLFGSDPGEMAEAARITVELGAHVVDVNMGCPVKKIVKTEAGSALLRFPDRAAGIVSAMVRAVDRPVTVKIRSGWDNVDVEAVTGFARKLEDAGAVAIAIHGRTRAQAFNGRADWSVIGAVKKAVGVPVIGNGDVNTPEDARRIVEETGCDAVMVGRGAIGRPWVFAQMNAAIAGEDLPPDPPVSERLACALRHTRALAGQMIPRRALVHARKHVVHYASDFPAARFLRQEIDEAKDVDALISILERALGRVLEGAWAASRAEESAAAPEASEPPG